jgi:hypothetical protein
MDRARVSILREVLAETGWVERTKAFGRALRRAPHPAGGLLLVGTPDEEPWHFAAHLDDEARWANLPALAPQLVRWSPPPGAPAHLSIGLQRLEQVTRRETVFVVAPDAAPVPLLERVADARKLGATVFAMDAGDAELASLSHEVLAVPPAATTGIVVPTFDAISHLVSVAAGDVDDATSASRFAALKSRIARFLDAGDEGAASP